MEISKETKMNASGRLENRTNGRTGRGSRKGLRRIRLRRSRQQIAVITIWLMTVLIFGLNYSTKHVYQFSEDKQVRVESSDRLSDLITNTTLQEYRQLLDSKYERTDFSKLALRQQAFAQVYRITRRHDYQIMAMEDPSLQLGLLNFLSYAEKTLYPWIQGGNTFKSIAHMHNSFSGKGYVLCLSGGYMKMGLSLINSIRKLNSVYPIEIFYLGDKDLSPSDRAKITAASHNVTCRNLLKIFDNKPLSIGGWAIKPFALLASSFKEAMLLDADDVFVQNPDSLFQAKGYLEKGTIFYKDRTLFPGTWPIKGWSEGFLPKPIRPEILNMRVYQGKSVHEMESGVVLVDKERRLPGLLSTCKMNEKFERDQVSYKYMHGDKETYWLGFEMVSEPFYFSPYRVGTPGKRSPSKKPGMGEVEICVQQILHLDESGTRPMWWNNALVESKYESGKNEHTIPFEEYFMESAEVRWDFRGAEGICLIGNSSLIQPMEPQDIAIIREFQKDWKSL